MQNILIQNQKHSNYSVLTDRKYSILLYVHATLLPLKVISNMNFLMRLMFRL